MKVLLFRSNNIFASRVNKYVGYYKKAGVDYTIIGWNRGGEARDVEHYEFCQYKAKRNIGGITAVKNHVVWMWFVFRYLLKHKDVTTIHACDVNVAYPAALFKRIFKRDVVLIFDACDWSSDNFAKYPVVSKIIGKMEKFAYKYSNQLIICEPERKEQIQFPLRNEPLVLPNIPSVDFDLSFDRMESFLFNNDKITFAYFGTFTLDRFLLEALELAKEGSFNLLIAGFGNEAVETLAKELNENCDNVKYFGKVDMKKGLTMSLHADAIFAFYSLCNPNHKYAAPNKYYEAMYLGLPLITNDGTILADSVKRNNMGYVLKETKESVGSFVKSITRDQLKEKGENARRIWDSKYSTYVERFFEEEYSKLMA